MEQSEHKCLEYLKSESERFVLARSPRFNAFIGWDDAQNDFLPSKLLPARNQTRTKTPVLSKVIQNINKSQLFRMNHRQTTPRFRKIRDLQDSGFFGHSVSQKRKEKIENSMKIFHNSCEKQEILKKKRIIIQHVLPDQCRVSGSFPNKFSFFKHPVMINSKKYFIIDSCL